MKKQLLVIFGLILFGLNNPLSGQYYDLGQDAASIRWQHIKTRYFHIIYPDGLDSIAFRTLHLLQASYSSSAEMMRYTPKRPIPVILHSSAAYSNGYVIWAPRRMELYTTPPADQQPQDWMQLLANHELRHVIQIEKLNSGLTKILSKIFGEQATAAVLGLYIPQWWLEGDAVLAETVFSQSGRGRLPAFEMELRALLLEKKIFSYDKAVFGSFKHFIPNHYNIGYHLVVQSSIDFGYEIWPKTVEYVARNPWIITPFSGALRKTTGMGKAALYRHSMQKLQARWKSEDSSLVFSEKKLIPIREKGIVSYNSAGWLDDKHFIALKTGMSITPRIVKIDLNGNETPVITPGILLDNTVACVNGKIVWAEFIPHLRWEQKSRTSLCVYDLKNNVFKRLKVKGRFYSPDLCSEAKHVAVVEVQEAEKYYVTIIDIEQDRVVNRFPTPRNAFPITPMWSGNDEKSIILIIQDKAGKRLSLLDVAHGTFTDLTSPSFTEISDPFLNANTAFFTSAETGINNIFCIDITSGDKLQLTSSRFGASEAVLSPDNKQLLYCEYTSNGYHLAIIPFATGQSGYFSSGNKSKLVDDFFIHNPVAIKKPISDSIVKFGRYRKSFHLFNFHSWGPFSVDASTGTSKPGFSVLSQNLLSTMFVQTGIEMEQEDNASTWFVRTSYKGLFPVIDLNFERTTRYLPSIIHSDYKIKVIDKSIETNVSIPLNISRGAFYQGVRPQLTFLSMHRNIFYPNHTEANKNFNFMTYRLFAYSVHRKAKKDLIPPWGIITDLFYRNDKIFSKGQRIASAEVWVFLPGLLRNHGIRYYVGKQKKSVYYDNDFLTYPRDVQVVNNDDLYSWSAEYHLPLFYPDFHLGGLLYVNRLKALVFYDEMSAKWVFSQKWYSSYGAEITADMHLFRFIAPVETGLRASFAGNKWNYSLLFTVGFSEI